MAGSVWILAASLFASLLASEPAGSEPRYHIVLFDEGAQPPDGARMSTEGFAQKVCRRHGCTVRHVYETLPGMAIRGGRSAAIGRSEGVRSVHPDLRVTFNPESARLVGAPPGVPLAYVGPGLDGERVAVERTIDFVAGAAIPRALVDDATRLVAGWGSRSHDNRFWSLRVLGADGAGRLSDTLAAVDFLTGFRYAVGAVYLPLMINGGDPAPMCAFLDAALQRGMLLLTAMDESCPLEPEGARGASR